jgi:hypothetical protein
MDMKDLSNWPLQTGFPGLLENGLIVSTNSFRFDAAAGLLLGLIFLDYFALCRNMSASTSRHSAQVLPARMHWVQDGLKVSHYRC